MIYIGIDPGKKGGIGVIDNVSGMYYAYPYTDTSYIEAVTSAVKTHGVDNIRVCVEKVNAMPGQGVVSVFTFGHGLGVIEGVLMALSVSYQLIRPQEWKKEFGLNSDKQASIDVCRKLFPKINLLETPRCRKEHDGMAEALLMAEYARRKL